MSTVGTLFVTLKKLHVNVVYRKLRGLLPHNVTSWINSLSNKYDYTPLVLVDELLPKYIKACQYLSEQLGADAVGDYLEFGVCHGTSMNCMHKALKATNLQHVRLFGFDSFEGLPESAASEDDGTWKPGEFASPLENTKEFLTRNGIDWKRTFLIKGWYSDTLTHELKQQYQISKASLIMVDCDLYSSSKQSLDFCAPLIKDKSMVFFDDWDGVRYMGEERAFDEFRKAYPNLKVEEFDAYKPHGKVFLITNLAK